PIGFFPAFRRLFGAAIRLLQINAPIAQLVQRDRLAADGAAHEIAGLHNGEIVIAEPDFRLGAAWVVLVHRLSLLAPMAAGVTLVRPSAPFSSGARRAKMRPP